MFVFNPDTSERKGSVSGWVHSSVLLYYKTHDWTCYDLLEPKVSSPKTCNIKILRELEFTQKTHQFDTQNTHDTFIISCHETKNAWKKKKKKVRAKNKSRCQSKNGYVRSAEMNWQMQEGVKHYCANKKNDTTKLTALPKLTERLHSKLVVLWFDIALDVENPLQDPQHTL